MSHQTVIVLDFGGQYNQLIARRVRECGVYCEVKSYKTPIEEIKAAKPAGIIFTGGPNSVYLETSPRIGKEIFDLGVPVLGICYGCQLMAYLLGGEVSTCINSEYGKTETIYDKSSLLFGSISDMPEKAVSWMSHTDYVSKVPEGFTITAHTDNCPAAAMENKEKKLYAVQFHPEVNHTEYGIKMIDSFLKNVCGCTGDWTMSNYAKTAINDIRAKVGDGKVLLALSGGVDSSVAATLLSRAIGKQLICIFVDHGFMRQDEGDEIESIFSKMDLHFVRVDAEARFLKKLEGVTDPERKRKIIGAEFAHVFEEEARKFENARYLAQGTIYPDIIESGGKHNAVIKSHHNVGGLPEKLNFKGVVEPLNGLFKNEVRIVGKKFGLPDFLINRQPFPGPGLAVRVMGEVTKEKCDILRKADKIYREEIEKSKVKTSQYFAVLTGVKTVGVMGDYRTYDYLVALRAVNTSDFMTAQYTPIPHRLLAKISSRIVNEVKGINRVCYDITSKPPSTIEWE